MIVDDDNGSNLSGRGGLASLLSLSLDEIV
jgi:hypothetical protein